MLVEKIDALYTAVVSPNVHNYDGSQNKEEFRDGIEYLNRRLQGIDSEEIWFLEIGAFKGLWALAFSILCELNNKIPKYVTVTWISQDPNNRDIFSTRQYFDDHGLFFHLVDANSSLPETVKKVRSISAAYNFVFIDGDHSFNGVMQDIKNYAGLATDLLLFHDINTRDCGVRKAINKSRVPLNLEISYGNIMGIGIKNCRVMTPLPKKKGFPFF